MTLSATATRSLARLAPDACGIIDLYDAISDSDGMVAFVLSYCEAARAVHHGSTRCRVAEPSHQRHAVAAITALRAQEDAVYVETTVSSLRRLADSHYGEVPSARVTL